MAAGAGGLALLAAAFTVATTASSSAVEQAALAGTAWQGSDPGAQAGGFTAAEFKNPDAKYRPAMRWWWQGPRDGAEAVREIGVIANAGFGEVEIAFSASAWASPEQRDILGQVLDEAAQLGVKVSMTMGAAWPVRTPNTGAGSGFASRELQYGRADVAGGDTFDGPVPDPIDAAHPNDQPCAASRRRRAAPSASVTPAFAGRVGYRPRSGLPVTLAQRPENGYGCHRDQTGEKADRKQSSAPFCPECASDQGRDRPHADVGAESPEDRRPLRCSFRSRMVGLADEIVVGVL